MAIIVIYGRKKVQLLTQLISESDLNKVSLSQLKDECSQVFQVDRDKVMLIYAGAIMKDEVSSLASYGINFRSKIVMLLSKGLNGTTDNSETNAVSFEDKKYREIRDIVNKTFKKVDNDINEFIEICHHYKNKLIPEDQKKSIEKKYLYLNEMLLKGLENLDNISAVENDGDSANEMVRINRKSAVNEIQELLNKLESMYGQLVFEVFIKR